MSKKRRQKESGDRRLYHKAIQILREQLLNHEYSSTEIEQLSLEDVLDRVPGVIHYSVLFNIDVLHVVHQVKQTAINITKRLEAVDAEVAS